MKNISKSLIFKLLLTLTAIFVFTAFAPLEKVLGAKARIVYLHGAWVWDAYLVFWIAGAVGLAALLIRRQALHSWSQALGRTALLLWLTFLPQSLYLMQANWNGLFFDEPRFRIPMNLAVVALLLQVGLSFVPRWWTSAANLGFAGALFFVMRGLENVLHPDSPIINSDSRSIQIFFVILVVLLLLLAWQIASWWRRDEPADRTFRPLSPES